jgi:hypothetical protein
MEKKTYPLEILLLWIYQVLLIVLPHVNFDSLDPKFSEGK